MFFYTATAGFAAYFFLLLQPAAPLELELVEEAVEDRGTLSTSLKILPEDMRLDYSFEKLYKVVGSEDVYVRRAGGLFAVFRNPVYAETSDGAIPIVPAGTIYCIGEVTPHVLKQLGVLSSPKQFIEKVDIEDLPVIKTQRVKIHVAHRKTIRFLDDERYRRQRLASFVLEVVLADGS